MEQRGSHSFGIGRGRPRGRAPTRTHEEMAGRDEPMRSGAAGDSAKRPRIESGSSSGDGTRGDVGGNGGQRGGRDAGGYGESGQGGRGGGGGRGARRGQRYDRNDKFDFVDTRPTGMPPTKKGNSGQQVALVANYFPVIKTPAWCLYNYRVDFAPDEDLRTPIKKALLRAHGQVLGGYIFDGSTMWTSHKLSPNPMTLFSTRESDKEKIEVTVRFIKVIDPTDVTYLQFYNIIVRKCMQSLQFEELGRHFYDRHAAISMAQYRLELWPGYITTMRNYENQLMLCVEMTHKVLNLDRCLSIIVGHKGNREAIKNELVGAIVMTHYNRKTYKIDDIDWSKTPGDTFDIRGEDINYRDYYLRKYQTNIMDMHQPLLVSRPKKRDMHRGQTGPILLIPELCQMTGLSDQTRSNFTIMRQLAQHLHQPPEKRFPNIQNFMRRIKASHEIQTELRKWDLDFDMNLATVTGRIVPKETVVMSKPNGTPDLVTPDDSADWKFAFRNKNMFSSRHLKKWVVIVSQRDGNHVDHLVRTMSTVGRPLGIQILPPLEKVCLSDTRAPSYTNAIRQVISNYKDRGGVDMIFIILPNTNVDLYSAVKFVCCVDLGIPSQCFLGKHLTDQKRLMSVATKVVIQMNAKLGGEPWAVSNPLKSSFTMVVGFDVHHCGKRKGKSVGAMVATTNKDLSKFYSTVSFHDNREELSGNLCTDITKCLFAFKSVNAENLPDRVIMFRDGVGDGQLSYVYNTELQQIRVALKSVYDSAGREEPKFSLIIVTKKINTRIAVASPNCSTDLRGLRNPRAGTVVDDVITLPERWDFYLIAQHANQGTVSPTAYNVIFDQQGLNADKIQRFTYKLTHMYYNWSGTVAVPAPCQYAHKLAYLTGIALKNEAHEKLSHQLYYL